MRVFIDPAIFLAFEPAACVKLLAAQFKSKTQKTLDLNALELITDKDWATDQLMRRSHTSGCLFQRMTLCSRIKYGGDDNGLKPIHIPFNDVKTLRGMTNVFDACDLIVLCGNNGLPDAMYYLAARLNKHTMVINHPSLSTHLKKGDVYYDETHDTRNHVCNDHPPLRDLNLERLP